MNPFDTIACNALLATLRDRVHAHGGLLEVFAGALPATLDADLSGYTRLVQRALAMPTFQAPRDATMQAMLPSGDLVVAEAAGVVGFYRVSVGGLPVCMGTAGPQVDRSLRVGQASVVPGQDFQISGWTIEVPH